MECKGGGSVVANFGIIAMSAYLGLDRGVCVHISNATDAHLFAFYLVVIVNYINLFAVLL